MTTDSPRTQKIHPAAYGALVEALAVIYWYKKDLRKFLCQRTTESPELVVGIDFDDYKRVVADEFVDRLMADEQAHRQLTLDLMFEVAGMENFPSLKRQADGAHLVAQAREAVADLRRWTEQFQGLLQERQAVAQEAEDYRQRLAQRRSFIAKLEVLKEGFLELSTMTDRQAAGRQFEVFLNMLFRLFDLEPRLSYNLQAEEIDGALSFDTDDYILEAKWWKGAVEAEDVDKFDAKVRRKGKNALGLFISVNGFSAGALELYKRGTSFVTMDGGDLFCVLDGRITLTELLRRKKRHANETGSCYFAAQQALMD